MPEFPYVLLDVFTTEPLAGNPLAVFVEVDAGSTLMQKIAKELNLSESVFVSRGSGGHLANLRIFTPGAELTFAGHPTIGAAIVLADVVRWAAANVTEFTVSEPVGAVPIRIERGNGQSMAWLTTPPVSFGREYRSADAAELLGLPESALCEDIPAGVAGAGSPMLYVPLRDPKDVDNAWLNAAKLETMSPQSIKGVFPFARTEEGAYARMFAPMTGISEDPATGGATGPLYAYLARHGALPERTRFLNRQGFAMGRPSFIHVDIRWENGEPARIDVGGNAVVIGRGALTF